MQMPHALGHAGRARRIQPERGLVGVRCGRGKHLALDRDLIGEFFKTVRIFAGDDDMFEIGHPPEHVLDHRQ